MTTCRLVPMEGRSQSLLWECLWKQRAAPVSSRQAIGPAQGPVLHISDQQFFPPARSGPARHLRVWERSSISSCHARRPQLLRLCVPVPTKTCLLFGEPLQSLEDQTGSQSREQKVEGQKFCAHKKVPSHSECTPLRVYGQSIHTIWLWSDWPRHC